ncbi:MAG: ribonuclease H-like domain-containing protein [Clostridiales bacterium]|nr:ribonuclease H-like domain-containing protein [Clostridiales bacterium]
MIVRQIPISLELEYEFDFDISKMIFFDIETTGFSPETTYLYLIGCIYYEASSFHLIQWFSEGIDDEIHIISSFFDFLKNYEIIIHYNGTGFDIPYILRKCHLKNLAYNFVNIVQIDLYKKVYPFRKLLKLPNCKQKTIEKFLHINRKDTFSGGELIEVYASYVGKRRYEVLKKKHQRLTTETLTTIESMVPSGKTSAKVMDIIDLCSNEQELSEAEKLLHQLLLHNEDDLKGLVQICPILTFTDLFEKPIRIQKAAIEESALIITFELGSVLPFPIQAQTDIVCFTAREAQASLRIQLFEGELKHFYDNYKDYFYLPAEDRAIHKSLAAFVDKDYRIKAKAATCYTRKQGIFVPQYEPVISPYFKQNNSDKVSFLEVHTDFLLQEDKLEQYVSHILTHILKNKA